MIMISLPLQHILIVVRPSSNTSHRLPRNVHLCEYICSAACRYLQFCWPHQVGNRDTNSMDNTRPLHCPCTRPLHCLCIMNPESPNIDAPNFRHSSWMLHEYQDSEAFLQSEVAECYGDNLDSSKLKNSEQQEIVDKVCCRVCQVHHFAGGCASLPGTCFLTQLWMSWKTSRNLYQSVLIFTHTNFRIKW